jgi:hypothetical protein
MTLGAYPDRMSGFLSGYAPSVIGPLTIPTGIPTFCRDSCRELG